MKNYWIPIVVGVVCAVIFFFVGKAAGGSAAPATSGFGARGGFAASGTGGFAARGGAAAGGGFATGQIVSVSGSSLTVQLSNGNSEVVFYSTSTQIIKPQSVSPSVLTPGTEVMIGGTANSDGSVSAATIQIRTGSSTFPAGGVGAGAYRSAAQ